jgi:hypothetical protein
MDVVFVRYAGGFAVVANVMIVGDFAHEWYLKLIGLATPKTAFVAIVVSNALASETLLLEE